MKKILYLLTFTILLVLPVKIYAKTYSIKDMDISIDNSKWYVFTRDNILNNPELDILGISYNDINTYMNKNNMGLNAYLINLDGSVIELGVVIKHAGELSNLHNYSEAELNKEALKLKSNLNADSYEIYPVGKYKYIHLKYRNINNSYYIENYFTGMNGDGYSIIFQKESNFTSSELAEIKNIVNSVTYKYNSYYEKRSTKSSSVWEKIITATISTFIVGLIFNRKNKKKKNDSYENIEVPNNTNIENSFVYSNYETEMNQSNKCPYCGKPYNKNDKYCKNCLNILDKNETKK